MLLIREMGALIQEQNFLPSSISPRNIKVVNDVNICGGLGKYFTYRVRSNTHFGSLFL